MHNIYKSRHLDAKFDVWPLVQIRIVCVPKFTFISLPINLNMCLIETVLLSTHNICFG